MSRLTNPGLTSHGLRFERLGLGRGNPLDHVAVSICPLVTGLDFLIESL